MYNTKFKTLLYEYSIVQKWKLCFILKLIFLFPKTALQKWLQKVRLKSIKITKITIPHLHFKKQWEFSKNKFNQQSILDGIFKFLFKIKIGNWKLLINHGSHSVMQIR